MTTSEGLAMTKRRLRMIDEVAEQQPLYVLE